MGDLHSAFPGLDVQIQLKDILESGELREHFRKHFRAFLHYAEDSEPALKVRVRYTTWISCYE